MNDSDFLYTNDQLKQIAEDTLRYARQKGASGAAVGISEGNGLSVSVRKGEIETIEKNQDKGIGITVFVDLGFFRDIAETDCRGSLQYRFLYFGG